MANWYGASRSNYFRVKDLGAFKTWAAKHEMIVFTKPDSDLVAISSDTEDGSWPSYDYEANAPFDFHAELAAHLREGEVAVTMTIGHEKLRYLTGHAEAIDHTGAPIRVDLRDIYRDAFNHFGIEPTEAIY